jgi:protease PrsW
MRKSFLIVLGVLIVLLIFINAFVHNPSFQNPEDTIKFALKSKQYSLAENTYRELIVRDSDNIDYHYEHIRTHFRIPKKNKTSNSFIERDDREITDFYQIRTEKNDSQQKDIGRYGLGLIYGYKNEFDSALSCFEKVKNKKLKYLNNSIGWIYIQKKDDSTAVNYFLYEIQNRGNLYGAYSNLISIYLKTEQLSKIEEMLKHDLKKYFSYRDLEEYYFRTSNIGKYTVLILSGEILSLDLKSFISALLIALIWLFYLRRIDIFEPEKWRYVILTFILGILFSFGTSYLSDIDRYILGFTLNGRIFNDFFYCFFGIGLVEELMKFIPFLIILKFTKEVNEPVDYIIYTSISALGFAFAENLLYFHGYGLEIIHGRALISVVVHMICSSIIGYGMYFGMQDKNFVRFLRTFLFLLIASFMHGLFDFWLINEKVNFMAIISILLIVMGFSVWHSFINNTLNYSVPEGNTTKNLDHIKLKDYLIYSLSGVLLFEYIIVSLSYGPILGNKGLAKAAITGAYLIPLISSSLSSFKIRRNHKDRIRFLRNSVKDYDAVVGDQIAIKKYSYDMHGIFPQSGIVVRREVVQNEKNWYLVILDKPIENFTTCKDHVMIKSRDAGKTIDPGSACIVGFYLIKNDNLVQEQSKTKKDLVFAGWGIIN